MKKNSEQQGNGQDRIIKIILAVVIGFVLAWFLTETILPAPFPRLAY